MAPVAAAAAGEGGGAPAEEIAALRQQVQRLLAQNGALQADLSKLQTAHRTPAGASPGEPPPKSGQEEVSGLQRAVNAAMQADQDVEVLRLEVVRRKGSGLGSEPVQQAPAAEAAAEGAALAPRGVSIEGRDAAKGPLAWCCQAVPCPGAPHALPKSAPPPIGESEPEGESEYEEVSTGPLARARRTADTMLVGARLHFSVRGLQKELEGLPNLDEDEVKERWDVVHQRNAQMAVQHIMKYRGFFIKVGQKASTMKGVLPDVWVEALEPLQDHIPITPFAAVRQTLQEDLGCSFSQVFREFQEKPIASASIGQAHIAWLRSTGEKVCVKVEHPGVAELSGQDLTNIEYIVKMMSRYHEEAPDFSEIIKEMRRSSLEEVDFRLEAKNATDALSALRRAGSAVGCPEPLLQHCGPRVLTMRFVEGWKITETERLPPGTDRETMAAQIVEAFAMLVFEEGLVHGDPHPGNIFVEQVGEGPRGLRPVLLDWGIVKRVAPEERVALAKWVVASLSRDRFLYLATLGELGVSIAGAADLEALDMFMFTGMLALRDTIPASSMRQFHEQYHKHREMGKESKMKKMEAEGKKVQKLVEKIPGWVHFFFRGLSLLQDVCGMLDVTVPVARVMLKYALPRLEGSVASAPPLRAPCGRPPLERAVRAKLEGLSGDGALLGVQVAVLRGERGEPGSWECDVAAGRTGLGAAPVSEATLMPLLDAGVGVLVTCLLAALSRPTVTGKEVGLDTPVERLWPEFSRSGKSGTTVRQLLQHRAGLSKPFRAKTSHKTICNEVQMEESVAACPKETECPSDACRVLGVAASALLRRATGHKSATDALRAVLTPLGLQEDITYHGAEHRMASAGHKMLEEVAMSTIWEMLEEQMQRQQRDSDESKKKAAPWMSWDELALEQPWCTDPLLVNSDDLRQGRGCCTGRGLRATARAVCQLLSSNFVPQELLDQSLAQPHKLRVASLEEWESLGRCLDVGAGWQLLRFTKSDGGGEVFGYGHVDGTTGSVALRVPGASAAVLLSCVDKDARRAGHELLEVIAAHLGLEPAWPANAPQGLPERGPASSEVGLPALGPDAASAAAGGSVEKAVLRLEAQVARLAEALGVQASVGGEGVGAPTSDLVGRWASAEVEGLEDILDALNVPAVARAFAKRMRRTLHIEVAGDQVSIAATTTVAGRQVEDTVTSFRVGDPFETQQMGNTCRGLARWASSPDANAGPEARTLVVEKRFEVLGQEVTLEEHIDPTADGRLAMRSTVRGKGEVEVAVDSAADLDALCRNLDAKTLRLKAEVQLGGVQVWRGGRVAGPASVDSFPALNAMDVPGIIILRYDDLRSTMMFDAEGGKRPRQRHAALATRIAGAGGGSGAAGRGEGEPPRAAAAHRTASGCCRGRRRPWLWPRRPCSRCWSCRGPSPCLGLSATSALKASSRRKPARLAWTASPRRT